MFLRRAKQIYWLLPALAKAATVTYTVPSSAPTGAAALDLAPVGVSYVIPC